MLRKKNKPLDIFAVTSGIWGMKDVFVNVYMIADNTAANWVLVDAGLKWSAHKIKKMARMLFGAQSKPSAIILTHGHFDHVGAVAQLAEEWDVPVYAHQLEWPYLSGKSKYPPPDPTVGGGLMASMAWMYPRGPINICNRLKLLSEDGSIPELPEWQYYHTPGHAPGHISLFREKDRTLISGDAFVTTKQESLLSVMTQKHEVNGPPKYFTIDWNASYHSVKRLADLKPEAVGAGHGKPIYGEELRDSLAELLANFSEDAVPAKGRYVNDPALTNEHGVVYVPPSKAATVSKYVIAIAAIAIVGLVAWKNRKKLIFSKF
ncbi:MAG: fold metallo-hydrolase [Chitinophagaceae bacterium]|nr:fold metallo-hydrolase [Chitinophagaceae bacterium]